MNKWQLTIKQVEAGYAAYKFWFKHIHTGEVRSDDKHHPSAVAAAKASDKYSKDNELYAKL